MDLSHSSFANDTMDSIGDSILASPKDIGEGGQAKALQKVGKDAQDAGEEHATRIVKVELEMAAENVNQEVLGDNTETKALTDLNDNRFVENLKNSMVENVEGVTDKIPTEVESAVDSIDINSVGLHNHSDPEPLVNDNKEKLSEEVDQLMSYTTEEAENVRSSVTNGLSETVDDVKLSVEVPNTDGSTDEKGELLDTVKKATMTAVSDVQAGATVKDAAQKAVTEVVSNVSPDISSNVSAGLLSFASGSGSPLPTKSTESRDNPFIPDGELSKETDELLKRATIIRDKFYLDQQERERQGLPGIDFTDHVDAEKSPIVESAIAPVSVQPAHSQVKGNQPATAEVKPRMRENGKLEDSVSPEGIKPEVEKGAAAASADGSKLSPPEASSDIDKDKKKQKKCCSIM